MNPELLREGDAAFRSGDLVRAIEAFEAASRSLTPDDDPAAVEVYEKLGIAYFYAGMDGPAIHALLRALDGRLDSRKLALRHLVISLMRAERSVDALTPMFCYLERFGAFPGGMRLEDCLELDQQLREQRSRLRPC